MTRRAMRLPCMMSGIGEQGHGGGVYLAAGHLLRSNGLLKTRVGGSIEQKLFAAAAECGGGSGGGGAAAAAATSGGPNSPPPPPPQSPYGYCLDPVNEAEIKQCMYMESAESSNI